MSASYEQRLTLVVDTLRLFFPSSSDERRRLIAEKILHDLDHIPEKVDWVSRTHTREAG